MLVILPYLPPTKTNVEYAFVGLGKRVIEEEGLLFSSSIFIILSFGWIFVNRSQIIVYHYMHKLNLEFLLFYFKSCFKRILEDAVFNNTRRINYVVSIYCTASYSNFSF